MHHFWLIERCTDHRGDPRTDAELRTYLSEFFLINVTDAEMNKVLTLYPQDVTQGSPFDTGAQNALTPQFKRIAAILGDLVFQAPRRSLLEKVAKKQNAWSYCTFHMSPCLCAQVLSSPTHASIPTQ